MQYNVLFLCSGNSARSIMAEALLNFWGAGRFTAYSAGSHPKGEVHPLAVEVLRRNNLRVDHLRSKGWEEFANADAPPLHFVFTVCDRAAAEVCPVWPGQPMTAHWGIHDPAAVGGLIRKESGRSTRLSGNSMPGSRSSRTYDWTCWMTSRSNGSLTRLACHTRN